MRSRALLLAACLSIAASFCLAGELKRIKLRDGRVIEGQIVEKTQTSIKVRMKLGELTFPTDQVTSMEDVHDAKADYEQRLAKLKKDDAGAQVELGRWAMEQGLLAEARTRFQAALELKKDDERAALLLRQVEAKLAGNPATPEVASTHVPIDTGRQSFDMKDMVRIEDIYRIRQAELREGETAAVEFRNDVLERFIKAMAGKEEFRQPAFVQQFKNWAPSRQARYMLGRLEESSPLRNDILIKSDPEFMKEFRATLWRYASGNCATSACHGSKEGRGGLKLYNFPGQNDHVDYTNFLILSSFHNKENLRKAINRDHPEMSMVLQHALPPQVAELKHPKPIPAAFSNRTHEGYLRTLKWIRSLEKLPRYDIRKRPPFVMEPSSGLPGIRGGTPTSAPASPALP
jgi:hypothetical protein